MTSEPLDNPSAETSETSQETDDHAGLGSALFFLFAGFIAWPLGGVFILLGWSYAAVARPMAVAGVLVGAGIVVCGVFMVKEALSLLRRLV